MQVLQDNCNWQMAFWFTKPVFNLFSVIAGATNWFGVCKDEAIIPKYLIGYGAVGIFMDTVFLLIQILAKPSYLKTTLKSTILFGAVLGNFACIFAITVFISYLEPKMSESLTYYCPGGLAYVYAYGLPVLGIGYIVVYYYIACLDMSTFLKRSGKDVEKSESLPNDDTSHHLSDSSSNDDTSPHLSDSS